MKRTVFGLSMALFVITSAGSSYADNQTGTSEHSTSENIAVPTTSSPPSTSEDESSENSISPLLIILISVVTGVVALACAVGLTAAFGKNSNSTDGKKTINYAGGMRGVVMRNPNYKK